MPRCSNPSLVLMRVLQNYDAASELEWGWWQSGAQAHRAGPPAGATRASVHVEQGRCWRHSGGGRHKGVSEALRQQHSSRVCGWDVLQRHTLLTSPVQEAHSQCSQSRFFEGREGGASVIGEFGSSRSNVSGSSQSSATEGAMFAQRLAATLGLNTSWNLQHITTMADSAPTAPS